MTDKMSFDMDGNGTTEQIHRANTNPYPPPPSDRDANSAWLVPLGRADAGRGIDAGHGPSTLHQQIVSLPPPHPATRRSPWSTPTLMRHATIFPAWWAFPSAAAMGLNTALAEQTAGSQRVDKWTPRHKVRSALKENLMSDAPTVNSVSSPARVNSARVETMRVHTAEPTRLNLSASFFLTLERCHLMRDLLQVTRGFKGIDLETRRKCMSRAICRGKADYGST